MLSTNQRTRLLIVALQKKEQKWNKKISIFSFETFFFSFLSFPILPSITCCRHLNILLSSVFFRSISTISHHLKFSTTIHYLRFSTTIYHRKFSTTIQNLKFSTTIQNHKFSTTIHNREIFNHNP